MKSLFNPVNNDRFCSNSFGAAGLGGAVSPVALRAVRANARCRPKAGSVPRWWPRLAGCPGTVVDTTDLGEFPAGFLTDKHMLELMTDRLTLVGQRVRQRILHQSQVDEVTSNKLQDLSYELNQQVWQLRAHMQ